MAEWKKNLLLVCLSLLIAFPLLETAFRILSGIPVFRVENFRQTNVVHVNFGGMADYDPVLGWVLKPNRRFEETIGGKRIILSTLDHGVRRNHDEEAGLRTGGVLVVGSSFAAGSEVSDEDAFAALLETLTGKPVVNGSNGGFGTDQIALRIEQLLPIVKPEVLILDIASGNITIASFAVAGRPKPYFTVEGGALRLHNSPVPRNVPDNDQFDTLKNLLGYSLVIDRLMASYLPYYWYLSERRSLVRVNSDGAEVTCLLLDRIKRKAAETKTRILLSTQYGSSEIESWKKPTKDIAVVQDCARKLGIPVVDEFSIMKALYEHDRDKYAAQFVRSTGNVLGHKSREGNLAVAQRLAAAMAEGLPPNEQPAAGTAKTSETGAAGLASDERPGDGQNLIRSESLERYSSRIAKVLPVSAWMDKHRTFRIVPAGRLSQHYISIVTDKLDLSPLTFSMEVHADTSSKLILQMVDAEGNGVYGTFDLERHASVPFRIGEGQGIRTGMERLDAGWSKIWISVSPQRDTITAYIEFVAHDGGTNFPAGNQSFYVRNVQLERGNTPSAYNPRP